MEVPAREVLEVVWDGMAEPGVVVFGLYGAAGPAAPPSFPHEAWPLDTDVRSHLLHGNGWRVFEWDIRVGRWPTGETWRAAVGATLQSLVDEGAVVAWLGVEGRFCDPPDLFDPACMPGGVLAVALPDKPLDCRVDPDEPLQTLSDEEMHALRANVPLPRRPQDTE